MLKYRASGPDDTRRLGAAVGRLVGPGDVVCLVGDLGAGKTVLVQGVAAGMGVRGRVTSPTFTIIHEHPGKVPLYHIDAYRLDGASDAETVGLEECLYGQGVAAVEWGERVHDLLPDERLDVEIRIPGDSVGEGAAGGERNDAGESEGRGEDTREIVLAPRGERFRRMVEELKTLAGDGD